MLGDMHRLVFTTLLGVSLAASAHDGKGDCADEHAKAAGATVRSRDAEARRGARPRRAAAEEPGSRSRSPRCSASRRMAERCWWRAWCAAPAARWAAGWSSRRAEGGPGVRVTFKDYGFFVPTDSAGATRAGARHGEGRAAVPSPGRAPASPRAARWPAERSARCGWWPPASSCGDSGSGQVRTSPQTPRCWPSWAAGCSTTPSPADNTPADMRAYLAQHFTEAALVGHPRRPRVPRAGARGRRGGRRVGAPRHRRIGGANSAGPEAAGVPVAREVEIRRFYVDGRHHGGDAGTTLLLASLAKRARALGAGELWLAVWERNVRAQGFYRQARFPPGGNPGVPVRQRHPDRRRAVPAASFGVSLAIVAGGSATRLGGVCKPLLHVRGRTVLARLLCAAHAGRRGAARLGRPTAARRGDAA